jgi:hypothetical protein
VDRAGSEGFVGDSPGEPFETPPDEPVAVEEPGTTAEEQRERSLERRLAMEEPDHPRRERASDVSPILDDDVGPEEVASEDPDVDPAEADLDRTPEEVADLSTEPPESPEEAALHIERE